MTVFANASETGEEHRAYTSVDQDIAVVTPETWGWTMEYLGKATFGEGFDEVKQGAQLVYSLSGAADVGTLVSTVYFLSKGQSDKVDKLEVTFATVGLGASVATVITTGGAGLLTVKGLLINFKELIKELVVNSVVDLLKTAVSVSKYLFKQLKSFVTSPSEALDGLVDFGKGINSLLSSGKTVITDFFSRVRSLRNLDNWLFLAKKADDCVVGFVPSSRRYAYAGVELQPAGLFESIGNLLISSATAATPLCPKYADWIAANRAKLSQDGLDTITINKALNGVSASLRAMSELGIAVNEQSVGFLTSVALKGGPDTVEGFAVQLAKIENPWGPSRAGVVDTYLEMIARVPDEVNGYVDWVKRMGSSQQQVTGLYGEAYQIDQVMESLRLADGSLPAKTEFDLNVRTERQYINTEGKKVNPNTESVDLKVSSGEGDDQLIILGESKVNGSASLEEAKENLFKQFVKHIELEVYDKIVDIDADEILIVPELRYSLQGKAFDGVDADELARESMDFLRESKPEIYRRVRGNNFFKFDGDSISIVVDKLYPIVK